MKNKRHILFKSVLIGLGGLLFVGGFAGLSIAIKERIQKYSAEDEIVDGTYVDGKIMVKMKASDIGSYKAKAKLAKGRELLNKSSVISSIDRTVMEQEDDGEEYVWYECSLDKGANINDAIHRLDNVAYVACAEPVYIRSTDALNDEDEDEDPIAYFERNHFPMLTDDINLARAKLFMEDNGIDAGGSSDIVVAVLDTGVDYTHPALRNNMWINTSEIPGNNIDDDNNGYVDDIYGVSVVGSTYNHTGDPSDVNGHGTHVAGIIAANLVNENGVQGIANNVRIMAIRAGQPSGVFTTSDIVDGINYAYRMGADVLNMSFGGYTRSQLEIDALQRAYNTTVLVAAAGNDSLPNLPHPYGRDAYPAALPWVVGVMSSDSAESAEAPSSVSYFSNYDYIANDSHEYEVCAPGHRITSTLPGNKYATWDGTSMAAPIVSGVAALVRSFYTDKVEYTSRFIMGQLSATGNQVVQGGAYRRIDIYKALTNLPQPKLELFDFFIDDSTSIDNKNDGDGNLDSGETVYIGISLKNRWGKAAEVSVKLDSISEGNVADPYIQYIRDTVSYGEIGAWEEASNGWIYDADSVITGINPDKAFIIKVADNTPNDVLHVFNLTITCKNGMDKNDTQTYVFDKTSRPVPNVFTVTSRNGRELPNVISEDMTLTKDFYWILPDTTRIEEGVTVTVEAGTQIQFYSTEDASVYAQDVIVNLIVRGKFITLGTPEEPVEIFPSSLKQNLTCNIDGSNGVFLNYTNVLNPCIRANQINSCYLYQDEQVTYNYYLNTSSASVYRSYQETFVYAQDIKDSIFYNLGMLEYPYYQFNINANTIDCCLFNQCYMNISYSSIGDLTNTVFLNNSNINEYGQIFSSSINYVSGNNDSTVQKVVEREADGTVYIMYSANSYSAAKRFATYVGGYIVSINDQDEYDFLNSNFSDNYFIGYTYDSVREKSYWEDGTAVTFDLLNSGDDKSTISGNRRVMAGSGYSTWGIRSGYSRYLIEVPQQNIIKKITLADKSIEIDDETVGYIPRIDVSPVTADKSDLVYASMDENVFVVSPNGAITATGKGSAELVISTSDGYITKSVMVNVVEKVAVENVEADVSDLFLRVNDSYQLQVSYTPTNTTEKTVSYESSNPEVIAVNEMGVVTALDVGSADIMIYDAHGVLRQTIHAQAEILVDEVSNTEDIYYSYVGQTIQLDVSHLPSTATLFEYTYESSNPDVATVDSQGRITILKEGYALVRVKDRYTGVYFDINVTATGTYIEEPNMKDIVFTNNYYYALSDEGNVYYWGNGVNKTTKLMSLFNVTNIFGYYTSSRGLALTSDGALYVLSSGGDGVNVNKVNTPEIVVRAFTFSNKYYFEVENGDIYAFGNNSYGSLGLGNNNTPDFNSPVRVFSYGNVRSIGGNDRISIIVTNNNETYYSGRDDTNVFTDFSTTISIKEVISSNYWDSLQVLSTNGKLYQFNINSFEVGSSWSMEEYFRKYDDESFDSFRSFYSTSSDYYTFVTADGRVEYTGYNDYGKFGSYMNNSWMYCYENYNVYEGYRAVKSIFNDCNSAIITEDGRIYMMGYSANGRMGFNGTGNVKTPKQVYFDVQVPGSLEISSCNLSLNEMNNNVNPKQTIEIKYNQGVVKGTGFNNIKIIDRNGNRPEFVIEVTINGFNITPVGSWDPNTSYTLTIPSGAVANNFGDTSAQNIIRFTSGNILVESLTFNDAISIDSITTNYMPDFTVTPSNADLSTLNWSSTNESVFVVDENGRITATGVGSAQLVAVTNDGFLRRVNTVTVYEHIGIESFLIGKDNYELIYGDSALIETTIMPSNATEPLSFISSDNSVVTVSPSGLIETVGTGNATITVSNNRGTITKTITVRVDRDVESISADSVIYGLVGQSKQLSIEIVPENATRVNLTYQSDNEEYVTVDENGLVRFLKAGLSTIRVTETNSKTVLDIMVSVSSSQIEDVKIEKVQVASDYYYALDTNGNVYRWASGISLPNLVATNVKDIAGSGQGNSYLAMLYNDNTVAFFDWATLRSTTLNDIVSIYSFGSKIFALASDDTLYAYGNSDYYSLGTGSTGHQDEFVDVGSFDNVKTIVGGYYCSIILLNDGTVYAAGGHQSQYENFTKLKLNIEVQDLIGNVYPYDGSLVVSKTGKLYSFDTGNLYLNSVYEGYYNTVNAKKIAAGSNDGKVILYEDGTVQFFGYNENRRFGNTNDSWVYNYHNLKPSIDLVKDVEINYANTFFITESGELYMMGSGSDSKLGVNNVKFADVPVKINFALENEKPLAVTSTTLDSGNNNIAKNQAITITFNQKIVSSNAWNNIRVETRTGTNVSIKRTLGLNSITITPTRGWEQGATYYLTIPDNSVKTAMNQHNEYQSYIFTTGNSIINNIYFDSGLAIDTNTADFYSGLHIDPSDGLPTDIIWESNNESVFTVDNAGNIHVVGVGSATLYARTGDNYCQATCAVTVTEYVALEQLVVGKTNYDISIYDNFQIEYSKLPSNATPLVTFESSDESVIRVNTIGYINAVGTGQATVTVRCADQVKTITFKVDAYADSISVETLFNVKVGDVVELNAKVMPENTTLKNLTYMVDNNSLATVDEDGKVTILGEGLITVRVSETVKGIVQDVIISATSTDVDVKIEKIVYADNDFRLLLDKENNLWGWSSWHPTPTLILTDVLDARFYYSEGYNWRDELVVLNTNHSLSSYEFTHSNSPLVATLYSQNELSDVAAIYTPRNTCYEILAVKNNGDIYVKGRNNYGCLGVGSNAFVYDFTKATNIKNIKSVAMTDVYTVILTENGDLYCAGTTSGYYEFALLSLSVDIIDVFASFGNIYAVSNLNNIYTLSSDNCSIFLMNEDYFNNTKKVINMSIYDGESYAYVYEDGSVQLFGYNYNYRLGGDKYEYEYYITSDQNNASGLSDIKQAYVFYYGTLLLKESGDLYYVGMPGGNLFGPFDNRGINRKPAKVEMTYPDVADVCVVSSTFDNGLNNIPNNQELRFEFNQKINSSSYYNSINIRTRSGRNVSISKTLKFNTLTISNNDLWEENEVYTLTIRADALRNAINTPNQDISYTFTVGPRPIMEMSFSSQVLNIDTNTSNFDSGFIYGPVGADLSTVVFESSDENIFSVNELGQVTGLSEGSGTLTVRTLDNALSTSIEVNVSQYIALENFEIGKNSYQMQYGNSSLIETTKTPTNATLPISFISNNEEVATVSTDGLITAVGTGSAVITVKCGEFSFDVAVRSDAFIDSIRVDTLIEGKVGESKQLDVTVGPDYATICELTYISDNEQIATVSSNGLITFANAGTANIRVKEINSNIYQDIIVSVLEAGAEKTNITKVLPFGDNLTLAIDDKGNLYSWGRHITIPKVVLTNVRDVCMYNGTEFAVLFENGNVEIWAYNDGDTIWRNQYCSISNVTNIYGCCGICYALNEDGILYAYGYNRYGKFGNGFDNDNWYTDSFNIVGEFDNLKNVVTSEYTTVILLENGTVLVAGTGEYKYDTFTEVNVNFDVENIYPSNGNFYSIIFESTAHKLYYMDSYNGDINPEGQDYAINNFAKLIPIHLWLNAAILDDGNLLLVGDNTDKIMNINKGFVYATDNYILEGKYPFVSVTSYYSSIFAIDSNGDLYGFGYKRFSNQFGFAGNDARVYTPIKICFDLAADNDVSIVSSTFDNGNTNIALDQKLNFVFNQKIEATVLNSIRVRDRLGNSVSVKRSLDFNRLTITPTNGWEEGKVYNVEIPANIVKNIFGYGNQAMSYTFTTGDTPVDNMYFAMNEVTIGDNISSYNSGLVLEPVNADKSTIEYLSSDESVFVVDENGLITATGVGVATLTARTTDGFIERTQQVTVTEYVALESFAVLKNSFQMQYGNTALIETTKTPSNATVPVEFVSNNEEVAIVTADGLIRTVGTGTAVITVKCGEFSFDVNVKSDAYISDIKCDTFIEDEVGKIKQISEETLPEYATVCELKYSSDNENVVSVDENGNMSFISSGVAIVRVQDIYSKVYADITIVVHENGFETSKVKNVYMTTMETIFALTEDGKLYTWNLANQTPRLFDTNVVEIACRHQDIYALKENGTLSKYFINGDSKRELSIRESNISTYGKLVKMFSSYNAVYVVNEDNALYVTGYNDYNRLGAGEENFNNGQFRLCGEYEGIKAICSNYSSTYMLLDTGEIYVAGTINRYSSFVSYSPGFDVLNIFQEKNSDYVFLESASHKLYFICDSSANTSPVNTNYLIDSYSQIFALSESKYAYILEDGSIKLIGYYDNIMSTNGGIQKFDIQLPNPCVKVFGNGNAYFFIDSEGQLYAYGYREYAHEFGIGNDDPVYLTPTKVIINWDELTAPTIISTNCDEFNAESTNKTLEIFFDQKVDSILLGSIKVKTRTGTNINVRKSLDFNKLSITSVDGWDKDSVYNVTIPSGCFKNSFGLINSDEQFSFYIGEEPIENMYFVSDSISINENVSNYDIGLNITPAYASRSSLIFESSDESVFTVNENGQITATGLGSAILTVRTIDGYLEVSQEILVKEFIPVEDITLEQTVYNIEVGESATLAKVISPSNATETIFMESSDSNIASITNSGVVTARQRGSATITIRNAAGDVVRTVEVIVKQFVHEIIAEEDVAIVEYQDGNYYQLQFELLPEGSADDADLEFISTDNSIAEPSDVEPGRVDYHGTGLVTIRVRDKISGCYHDFTLSIKENVSNIKLIQVEATATEGAYLLDDKGNVWRMAYSCTSPIKLGLDNITKIKAGNSRVLALSNEGKLFVISGSGYDCFTELSDVVDIFGTWDSYFAVLNDNSLWGFGSNDYYCLGLGDSNYRDRPTYIGTFANIKDIVASAYGSVMLLKNGDLYTSGYLGNKTFQKIAGYSNVEKLVDGFNWISFVCNGSLYTVSDYNSYVYESNGNTGVYVYQNLNDYDYDINVYGNYPSAIFKVNDYEFASAGADIAYKLGRNPSSTSWWHDLPFETFARFDEKVISFSLSFNNSYFVTESGKLYATGLHDYLGYGIDAPQQTPHRIRFDLATTSLVSSVNNVENIALNQNIEIKFNQKVTAANLQYISVRDNEDNYVATINSVDLNKIIIKPYKPWKENTTYSVYVQYNTVRSMSGESNDQISFNFATVASGSQPGQGIEGQAFDGIAKNNIRVVADKTYVEGLHDKFVEQGLDSKYIYNAFMNDFSITDTSQWMKVVAGTSSDYQYRLISFANNYWGTENKTIIEKQIIDYDDFSQYYDINPYPILTDGIETMYPFVTKAQIIDEDNNVLENAIRGEENRIRLTFNRDMDTTIDLNVFYGPDMPYTDWKIEGEYVDSRTWEGTFTTSTLTGNGLMHLFVVDGAAADNNFLKLFKDQHFTFTIRNSDTAESLDLSGEGSEGRVILNWEQDDFDTLAGYNVYRADSPLEFSEDQSWKDNHRINNSIISEKTYEDLNVEPGRKYYYRFTVVTTDFLESEYSNVLEAAALDTIPPVVSHSVVSSGITGCDVRITANITDNVGVESATLYYSVNNQDYVSMDMTKLENNEYTAIIPGKEVKDGNIKYYIVGFDGITNEYHGSANQPHYIEITSKPVINSISPNYGDIKGGDVVTITGMNFHEGDTVRFGSLNAQSVEVVSESLIRCVVPASQVPSTVNVIVSGSGGRYTLINGYTYTSNTINAEIPTVKGTSGSIVDVPINLQSVKGLLSADINVGYNPNQLQFVEAVNGTLGKSFALVFNNKGDNVSISLAGANKIDGSGSIVVMKFRVLMDIGSTSALSLNTISLNGGNIDVETKIGNVIAVDALSISGRVRYYSSNEWIEDVNVQLSGTDSYSVVTDGNGNYTFNNLGVGTYNVNFSKDDGVNGITAYDASLILQYKVGLKDLLENQLIAADANNNGVVDSFDASLILQYSVGLIELPFSGRSDIWVFKNNNQSLGEVSENYNLGNNFAILVGDVSGDYSNSSNGYALGNNPYGAIQVDKIEMDKNKVIIPVRVKNGGASIYSVQFNLMYSSSLTYAGYSLENSNAMVAVNSNVEGTVRVATASAQDILDDELVYYFTFFVKNSEDKYFFRINNSNINEHYNIVNYGNALNTNASTNVTVEEVLRHYNETYLDGDISRYDFDGNGIIDMFDVIKLQNMLNT